MFVHLTNPYLFFLVPDLYEVLNLSTSLNIYPVKPPTIRLGSSQFGLLFAHSIFMNHGLKSHFETAIHIFKRVVIILVMAIFFLSFQNCAPSASATKSNDSDPSYLSNLENKIAAQNDTLLKLSAANLSCSENADCTTVEVGRKGCGGPRGYYVVSKKNDLAKIQAISLELMNLEAEYIVKKNYVSTCEVITPPAAACISSFCK